MAWFVGLAACEETVRPVEVTAEVTEASWEALDGEDGWLMWHPEPPTRLWAETLAWGYTGIGHLCAGTTEPVVFTLGVKGCAIDELFRVWLVPESALVFPDGSVPPVIDEVGCATTPFEPADLPDFPGIDHIERWPTGAVPAGEEAGPSLTRRCEMPDRVTMDLDVP